MISRMRDVLIVQLIRVTNVMPVPVGWLVGMGLWIQAKNVTHLLPVVSLALSKMDGTAQLKQAANRSVETEK